MLTKNIYHFHLVQISVVSARMIESTYEAFHVDRVDRVGGNETAILLEGVHQVEQAHRSGFLVCPVVITRSTSNVNLESSKIRLEGRKPFWMII